MACSDDKDANIERAEKQIRDAASQGAQVILIQELFETPYFCKDQNSDYFELRTGTRFGFEHFGGEISGIGKRVVSRSAHKLFRACQQRLLQFHRHYRRRRCGAGHLPQVTHPELTRLPGKILFQPGRHRLSRLANQICTYWRRNLLGSVVSGSSTQHGVAGRRSIVVPDRHWFGTRLSVRPDTGSV